MENSFYTESEKLDKTYFSFDNDDNEKPIITTGRILGETNGTSFLFFTAIQKKQPNDIFSYYILSVPTEELNQQLYPAKEILNDGFIWVFKKDEQEFTVLTHKESRIAFFDSKYSKEIVYAVDIDDKFEKYQNSPNKIFDDKDEKISREILLKHIDYTGNFKNQHVLRIMTELYKKITTPKPKQEHDQLEIIKILEYVVYTLKNGTEEQIKEILDTYFEIIQDKPDLMQQLKQTALEKLNIKYEFDPHNISQIKTLSQKDKSILLGLYLRNGLDEGIFSLSTTIEEEQDALDKASNDFYQGILLLQKEMGIVEKDDNKVLFNYFDEFKPSSTKSKYMA